MDMEKHFAPTSPPAKSLPESRPLTFMARPPRVRVPLGSHIVVPKAPLPCSECSVLSEV